MDTELVKCEVSDFVALVTMDNPPVNAQNTQFHHEMMLTFDTLSDRDDIRVVVLTGAGKNFSAGADIKGRSGKTRGPGEAWQHNRNARECFHSIMECRKPVIGAVNGVALGAGLAVAASCDILFAAENTLVGLPEINVGLLGGGRHAMRLFGHSTVRRMMFTGYRIPGLELYRLGVVEGCVAPEDLLDTAMEMARDIASKSPIAMGLAKEALNAIEEMSLRDGYRYEQNKTTALSKFEDSSEAMLAFAEKRAPVFKGR
ncbi:MAG: enoyl-CoA hydratase/carnithine racemase [Alphaproteobacteria bacterium]|jgi:enoyl-CoA hydratase